MYLLRRSFHDGTDRPELVLIHYSASPEGSPERLLTRSTAVASPSGTAGKRQAVAVLPRSPEGGKVSVRYFFSAVGGGREWFSPEYEVTVPGGDAAGDVVEIEEENGGNASPAAGWGTFRIALPMRRDAPRTGRVRYGFGAMRKKPSVSLCRACVEIADGSPPVVEIPRALSVLKNRPMPYFLYHACGEAEEPIADKITCVRITLADASGDFLFARILWGDRSWKAQNLTVMEARNFPPGKGQASGYFHAGDRDAWLSSRIEAIRGLPVPRTYEGFVFGPSGSVVEYCFQVVRAGEGETVASWINSPSGGNWTVTL